MEILLVLVVVIVVGWLLVRTSGTKRVPEEHVEALDILLRDRALIVSLELLKNDPKIEDEEAAATLQRELETVMGTKVVLSNLTLMARYILASYRLAALRSTYGGLLKNEGLALYDEWIDREDGSEHGLTREWSSPPGALPLAKEAFAAMQKRFLAKMEKTATGRDHYFEATERRLLTIIEAAPFTRDLRRLRDR